MEKVKAQKRNGELDFFKLLFCIVVISFHSGYFIQSENGYFKGGSIAVDFFFVVSGVMMARNAAKKAYEENLGIDTFEFMKKKILRFMPDIYVAWVIAFVVKHWHFVSWKQVVKDLFASIWELLFLTNTGIVGYSPNDASYLSNDATWYISAMILSMLLLWPLLRKYKENFFRIDAQEIMSRNPKTISPDVRITAAEEMMRVNKIHSIIVVDDAGAVAGVVEFFNVSVLG